MKKEIVYTGLVLVLLLISGCGLTEKNYVCPDGSVVKTIEECTKAPAEETPQAEEPTSETPSETTPSAEEPAQVEEPAAVEEPASTGGVMTTITVKEGELVSLKPQTQDADSDKISYTFSKPLDQNGRWQTKQGDAGNYQITVTASDGELKDTQTVLLVVESTNRPPVIRPIADMTVNEGDTVTFRPVVTDSDGDTVQITYSGWMTSASYQTTYDDAGNHLVTITASDGKESSMIDIMVTVNNVNRAPKIVKIVQG